MIKKNRSWILIFEVEFQQGSTLIVYFCPQWKFKDIKRHLSGGALCGVVRPNLGIVSPTLMEFYYWGAKIKVVSTGNMEIALLVLE